MQGDVLYFGLGVVGIEMAPLVFLFARIWARLTKTYAGYGLDLVLLSLV